MTNNSASAVRGITKDSPGFENFCDHYRAHTETLIDKHLDADDSRDATLLEAMRYGVLGGGKRVRALLTFAAAQAVGTANTMTDAAAVALECIHAYSLIHDDLPAMDDDDLRRGKPSCHIAYDEATAILAGDALQTTAFEIMSQPNEAASPVVQLEMINLLTAASGQRGMVAGQSIDLHSMNLELSLDELINMHRLKTGALIRASIILGATSAGVNDAQQLNRLEEYAEAIGLAFQIQDDILDVTSDTNTLGKQQGADAALNKPTFVSLMGLEEAKQKAQALHAQALEALSTFGPKAQRLEQLANYIIHRHN